MKRLSLLLMALGLAAAAPSFGGDIGTRGAVYAMTNAADDNQVLVFDRAADGSLRQAAAYTTRGKGGGGEPPLEPADALGSQSSLVLSDDGQWLFAANAGSNELSLFRTRASALSLTDKVPSNGDFPVSVAQHKQFVFVLNSGGEGNITGFTFDRAGHLHPLPGSTRSLGAVVGDPFFLFSPAQVGFTPKGDKLIVVIKGMFTPTPTHRVLVYDVDELGMPSTVPVTTVSPTTLSFGFAFDRAGHLIVAEPFGASGAPGGGRGAMSSYDIADDGTLHALTSSLTNAQNASCWAAVTGDGRFAYTTNNGSATITGYRVDPRGQLQLLDRRGISAYTDPEPVDLAVSRDSRFLYNINAGTGTIGSFRIDRSSGALTSLGVVGGLPLTGAAGIAVR